MVNNFGNQPEECLCNQGSDRNNFNDFVLVRTRAFCHSLTGKRVIIEIAHRVKIATE
jgi:hypothetical protein